MDRRNEPITSTESDKIVVVGSPHRTSCLVNNGIIIPLQDQGIVRFQARNPREADEGEARLPAKHAPVAKMAAAGVAGSSAQSSRPLRSPAMSRGRWRRRLSVQQALLSALGLSIGALAGMQIIGTDAAADEPLACTSTRVIDGDTFDCAGTRIRLQGIDTPEMPGHCRRGRDCTPGDPYEASANLERLIASGPVNCVGEKLDHYGRTVARCTAGEVDLSCAQLDAGVAARRYALIWCGLPSIAR
jgi:endonuclease YncB( thermonuclease family)